MADDNGLVSIQINTNLLRLVANTFLYIQPDKDGLLSFRGVYQIASIKYGILGWAHVKTHYTVMLSDLRPHEVLIANGTVLLEEYRSKGVQWTDKVSVYTLQFTSRQPGMSELLAKEAASVGIPLTIQTTLL